jgi:hypothetical protein
MRGDEFKRLEVVKRIYDLRTQGESFHEITPKIIEEFNIHITDPTVKKIYNQYISRSLLVNAEAEKKEVAPIIQDYQAKMDARFDKIAKVTDELMDSLTKLKNEFDKEGPEGRLLVIKLIPSILAVSREILAQLQFIKREQSNISITQKNMIYSPMQIMQVLNKEMTKMQKDGKIIMKAKNGRFLTEEEKKDPVFSRVKEEEEFEDEIAA